jgi:ATPase subunit of ABC transporter with duplicated ATPase domains
MHSILLTTKNIGLELPHKTLFKELSLTVARGHKIGLIGRNGEGKSSLLKILARMIEPTSGSVAVHGRTSYMPQLDLSLFESSKTTLEFAEENNSTWPLIQASLSKLFHVDWLEPERELRTLSGGELAKLFIAINDMHSPDILLLDEPTNHLDVEGLEVLKSYLTQFKGVFIIASHDPAFLNQVTNEIWELEQGVLTIYGGNYFYFEEQKRLAVEAQERALEAKRKDIKKTQRALQAQEIKSARAIRTGKKAKAEPSRDKYLEGYFKNRSEQGTGRARKKLEQVLEEQSSEASQLKGSIRKKTYLNLQAGEISRRSLLRISNGTLRIDERVLIEDINLNIDFGDRIVITGKNGSGKSTLARSLVGLENSLAGDIRKSASLRAVYMDQKYQIVDPNLSLVKNIERTNPELLMEEVRRQLGRFLFNTSSNVMKKASDLSGGETARLALAMITAQSLDLLILDEPTNNLDIETLDIITDALVDFSGAILVISHNVHFLSELEIGKAYVLRDQNLKEMKNLPNEEGFYSELVNSSRNIA